MNNEVKNEVKELMMNLESSFINGEMELILIPKSNTYFLLEGIETKSEIIARLFMWASRDIAKHHHKTYREINRMNLNNYLGTKFSQEDMELIYRELGNGINKELTYQFIDSGFDMEVLK